MIFLFNPLKVFFITDYVFVTFFVTLLCGRQKTKNKFNSAYNPISQRFIHDLIYQSRLAIRIM
jgi:hypothetical protein